MVLEKFFFLVLFRRLFFPPDSCSIGFGFDSGALSTLQLKKGKIIKQQQQDEEKSTTRNGSTAADGPKGGYREMA